MPDSMTQTPPAAAKMGRGLLLVIAGPSGVGKTTIVHELLKRYDGMFSVSATTRTRAPGETEGVDYFFVDRETFQKWVDEDRFLEVAQVFGRDWYGTPRGPVQQALDAGKLVVLDIDVQGAESVRTKMPQMLGVFILPPSEEELLKRLRSRGRDEEATIQRRFAESKSEIARARKPGTFDHFVTNDSLPRAIDEVAALVRAKK